MTFLLIKKSTLYRKWVKVLVGFYYVLMTIIFINGYHRTHEKYNMYDGPVFQEGWKYTRTGHSGLALLTSFQWESLSSMHSFEK